MNWPGCKTYAGCGLGASDTVDSVALDDVIFRKGEQPLGESWTKQSTIASHFIS